MVPRKPSKTVTSLPKPTENSILLRFSFQNEKFLEAVSPAVAIYTSGYGNPFGLPEKATLDRVRRLGAKIYGTDKNGSIFVTIDSNGYKVVVSKGK